jgi:hypothetical protein
MKNKILISFLLIFSLLIFIQTTYSLSVSCEIGGPYLKNSTTGISMNVVGNVTSPAAAANITVSISQSGALKTSKDTTADSQGAYSTTVSYNLDAGTYDVNVSAEQQGTYAFCNDTLEIQIPQAAPICLNRNLQISGNVISSSTGQLLSSGKVFASVLDESVSNSTSFTNGRFSISISGCLKGGKRYILQIIVESSDGSRSWFYTTITW